MLDSSPERRSRPDERWPGVAAAIGRTAVAIQRRLHRQRPKLAADFARSRLRALLQQPGCPVCRDLADQFARFKFWFLLESYGEAPWISRLTASLGLCPAHFWALARYGPAYQLSYVAQYLSEDYIARLRAASAAVARGEPRTRTPGWWRRRRVNAARKALAPTESCPACADAARWERALLRDLVACIDDPDIRALYRGSGGLCARHLQRAVRVAGRRAVIEFATTWLAHHAPDDAGSEVDSHGRASRVGFNGTRRLAQFLEGWVNAVRLQKALSEPGCPVCRETGMRFEAFAAAWLGELHEQEYWRERVERAGGFCSEHDRLLAARDVAGVQATVRDALDRHVSALVSRLRVARTHPKGKQRWPTVAALAHVEPCPACELEALATERAIAGLLTLVDRPEGRARYAASDGVCVRHFHLAARRASTEGLAFLASEMEARLTRLWRETREFFRKTDWNHRDEPKGEEQSAWLRTIERSVGPARMAGSGAAR